MARKTLKQKLRKQLRQAKVQLNEEHNKAGHVINYELQAMQAVALAHGLMAALISAKNVLGDDPRLKEIEEQCQARIAQCYLALIEMGFSHEDANARIIKGH